MVSKLNYFIEEKNNILHDSQDPKANTTEIPTGLKKNLKSLSDDHKQLENQSKHCWHSKQATKQDVLYNAPQQI